MSSGFCTAVLRGRRMAASTKAAPRGATTPTEGLDTEV
jgi:hypothetical protein